MKKVSFVYFDLGGVMFNYRQSLIELSDYFDRTIEEFDKIFSLHMTELSLGKLSLEGLWTIYQQQLDLPNVPDFNFFDYWTDNLIPIQESQLLAENLAENYNVGILSNMYQGVLEKIKANGILRNIPFSAVVQSYEEKFMKPQVELFQIAQQKAQAQPSDILFIDDTAGHVEAARNLGWNGIVFNTTKPKQSVKEVIDFLLT